MKVLEFCAEEAFPRADVFFNKPQGMTVHAGNGNREGTLVNALLFRLDSLSGINGKIRPGIVHRIDKDTSGLLVVAKNDGAHLSLSEQIKEKSCKREYLALLEGVLKEDTGRGRGTAGGNGIFCGRAVCKEHAGAVLAENGAHAPDPRAREISGASRRGRSRVRL